MDNPLSRQTNGGWGSENRGVVPQVMRQGNLQLVALWPKKIVQNSSLYVLVLIGTKKSSKIQKIL
jgi:hypothetical protein